MIQQPANTSVRVARRGPFILVGVLLVLQLFLPASTWRILLVGLVSALAASYIWMYWLARRVALTRHQRGGWVVAGDVLDEFWTLDNRGPLPVLWAEVIDHSTLPAYRVNRVVAVGAQGQASWRSRGVCQQRGLFTLGPCELHMGDPFGFIEVVQHYPAIHSLLVYPRVMRLPPLELPRGGATGRARRSRRAWDTDMAASHVRPMVAGDSMRRVAWRATAHRGAFMVREFDQEPTGDLWIVLDLDRTVQVGVGTGSSEEFAIVLGASLAAEWLRQNRAVGLVALGDPPLIVPPQRSEAQLWRILEGLAPIQTTTAWPLAQTLERVRPLLGHGITLTVITPSLAEDWVPPLLMLARRGMATAAILLDPAGFDPEREADARRQPMVGLLAEHGVVTHVVDQQVALKPLITHRRHRTEYRALATGRVVTVEVDEDV
jgi:uncharacterized protein (DUF58 family)